MTRRHNLHFMDEKVNVTLLIDNDSGMYSVAWSRDLTKRERRKVEPEFFKWRNEILDDWKTKHPHP
jgi:hypothetical protein